MLTEVGLIPGEQMRMLLDAMLAAPASIFIPWIHSVPGIS